jgi:FAD/FMN-containing dehydrogenase
VLWGELDAATQALGLATTGGMVSHTGVAGLTLGGGIGWLMRRHGVTVDNLLGAEVVTVDGEHLDVNASEHPELFWGLRGGGLGVVTSFTYRLHPVGPEVLAGHVVWSLEDAPELLRAYRELVASAPPEVATVVTLRHAPMAPHLPPGLHRRPVCLVGMLALAEPEAAARLLAPFRAIGRPLLDLVTHRPYANLQSMIEPTVPHGWHYYWKAAGLRALDDTLIDAMVDHSARALSPRSFAVLFHLGGAVAEVDPGATAHSRGHVAHELIINAAWLPNDPIADAETAWAKAFLADLEPQHAGAYLNFLDHDDRDRATSVFDPDTHHRLAQLRQRFDPDGVLAPDSWKAPPPAPPPKD